MKAEQLDFVSEIDPHTGFKSRENTDKTVNAQYHTHTHIRVCNSIIVCTYTVIFQFLIPICVCLGTGMLACIKSVVMIKHRLYTWGYFVYIHNIEMENSECSIQ